MYLHARYDEEVAGKAKARCRAPRETAGGIRRSIVVVRYMFLGR